jgi:DnaJ-class molecular chaperone
MLWHPDKHVGAAEKKKARDQFLQIRTAYETLRDPERRKNYDLGLPHGESPPF